jgi:hypothetical protein
MAARVEKVCCMHYELVVVKNGPDHFVAGKENPSNVDGRVGYL